MQVGYTYIAYEIAFSRNDACQQAGNIDFYQIHRKIRRYEVSDLKLPEL